MPAEGAGKSGNRKGPYPESREKAIEIAGLALDKKARNVQVLELLGLTEFADYFVICSGDSTQQVKAIVDNVEKGLLERRGDRPLGVEGRGYAHWVLMDYNDVVVHVFERETRDYYELEKLWLDAPRVGLPRRCDAVGHGG